MPLTTIEQKEIGDGFKAAGERMGNIESDLNQLKQACDEFASMVKLYGRAIRTGRTETGGEYRRFWHDDAEAKAFGELFLIAANKKAMGENVNVEGGVLVPEEMSANIIQKLGKYGKFRRNALVVPVGSDRQIVPKVEADLTIYSPGEGNEITESDMAFNQVGLNIRKLACLAKVSSELEEDSIVALGEILGMSMTRSLAKKEDEIGFVGDGTSTYFGMTGIVGALLGVDAVIANIKGLVVGSGNAYSELTLGDFKKVVGLLPEECDDTAKWYVHKRFYYNVIHVLAEAAGIANVFEILTDRKQRYLYGYPVEFVHCMPYVEADSQICAMLGDLQLGAFLGERKQVTIGRSSDVYFANDQIGFRGIERIAVTVYGVGDTTEPGPIVGLITAAS